MSFCFSEVWLKLHDFKGRLIAYGGGGGVSLFSNEVAAKAQQAAQTAASTPDITLANLISLGGLALIAARFIFDVYVYFDKKRAKGGARGTCSNQEL
ncbi:hypothetical protein K6U49_10315 [Vibrio alginolyticus]|uniref:hypothetical protein n=1 Tax=Vibrio TaxID=662 RepID=UPI001EE9E408|nr:MULTISPECIES: hypothetical protein [Vibrio]MCG6308977.1 hypothetical protein [Vibrio alginolyticus]MDW3133761.1 hypothetical protein [Vibrio sp. 1288]